MPLKPYIKSLIIDSPSYRNEGTIELSKKIYQLSKENKDITIYVTNFPDNVYPWYAFLNNINPHIFNKYSYMSNTNQRTFLNIVFTDQKCPSDEMDNFTSGNIIIDSGYCEIESKLKDGLQATIIDKITRTDQTNAFYILRKN